MLQSGYSFVNFNWSQSSHVLANIVVVDQPPFLLDLSSCDYFLFSTKSTIHYLKAHHFGTIENIKKNVTGQLKEIPVLVQALVWRAKPV